VTGLGGAAGADLFSAWRERPGWAPMSPGTVTAILLIGVGLATMDSRRLRGRAWGQVLLVAAMSPAVLSLGLYLFGAPIGSGLSYLRPMAIHTAPAIVMLASAGLMIRPEGNVMEVATGDTIGSAMLRLMLPVVVAVPVALGWLHLAGQKRGLYDASQDAAVVATVTAMLLVAGLWVTAHTLRRAELERRRMEHELAESQREAEEARSRAQLQQLELKDQFLSHVSHELRSPLTVIYSLVEILLDGLVGEINDEQREFLAITMRNSNQLRQMIEDLLEVTRAQTGKLAVSPRRMSLSAEIETTLEGLRPQAEAKGLVLGSEFPDTLPAALADPFRVRQVLVNLIDNAIKFTPEGGSIRVAAALADGEEELTVSVRDTGSGIPTQDRDDIFRQLYQLDFAAPTARRGLGLGLFICRELVTRMAGKIWVESEVGRGSEFSFTVPLYSPTAAIATILTPENRERREFRLILVSFEPTIRRTWGDRDDAAMGAVVETIRGCVLPDLDLVLPRLGASEGRESVCVLVAGGDREAASLAHRIEGQLPRCEALKSARLAWSIVTLNLELGEAIGQDAHAMAAALSSRVEEALDELAARRNAA
jgi:signal transduction histidine kinase